MSSQKAMVACKASGHAVDNHFFQVGKMVDKGDPSTPVIVNGQINSKPVEFDGLWEEFCNAGFKPLEFERFKTEAGSNYFLLSPQRWIAAYSTSARLEKGDK